MADLNALIAQGYQFQAPPDPFAQYGKMQQLENSATQNRLAQQQMTENAQLAPLRMREAQAKLDTADLTYKQLKGAEEFVAGVMQKAQENGSNVNDPMDAAMQMLSHPNPKVQEIGKHLAEAQQLVQGIKQQQAYAQGEPTPNSFGVPATPAPGAAPMVPRAAGPVDLAPAAQGEAGTPVLTGNALAPPSVNAMKPSADTAESIAAKIRKGNALYGNTPGWLNDRTLLVEQYKALINPNQRTYAPIDASKYTPASLKAFNLSGDQSDLVAVTKADKIESPFGKIDPDKFTPASLAKYAESNNFKDLVPAPKAPGAAATPAAPVAVVGSDGKVKYVSREEAISKGMTPASAMEGLAPKEIQNREAKYPVAKRATATVSATMTEIENTIDRLLANENGLNGITGFVGGRTFAVTDAARKAEADLKQLKNLAFVQGLTELRNASSTGAGVGNVSNKEGDRFENLKASLEQTQSTSDLIASLKRLKSQSTATRDTVNQAFEDTYAYRANAPAAAAPAAGGGEWKVVK